MDDVIGLLYEKETETSKELQEIDKEFEKQLNCIVKEFSKNISEDVYEDIRDRIFAILMPMKKEIFIYGFKRGTQMLIEGISHKR